MSDANDHLSAQVNATFTCPRCGATSGNPTDVREGYCGACHDWTRVDPSAPFRQYVIYDHPRDYPGGFVMREWKITGSEITPGPAVTAATLEQARSLVPPGLYRLPRFTDDDAVIVEVWL